MCSNANLLTTVMAFSELHALPLIMHSDAYLLPSLPHTGMYIALHGKAQWLAVHERKASSCYKSILFDELNEKINAEKPRNFHRYFQNNFTWFFEVSWQFLDNICLDFSC